MKKILRTAGVAAGLVSAFALGATPANAAAAVAFAGTANIDCFGCGVSSGTADLCAWVHVSAPPPHADSCLGTNDTTAEYTVNEPAFPLCLVTGTASGSTSGHVNVDFNWTRVGATAVITTTGDINGAGVAAFVVTSPVGNPCGGPVTAQVAGAIAGQ